MTLGFTHAWYLGFAGGGDGLLGALERRAWGPV